MFYSQYLQIFFLTESIFMVLHKYYSNLCDMTGKIETKKKREPKNEDLVLCQSHPYNQ